MLRRPRNRCRDQVAPKLPIDVEIGGLGETNEREKAFPLVPLASLGYVEAL
jgi:hypothetical protein